MDSPIDNPVLPQDASVNTITTKLNGSFGSNLGTANGVTVGNVSGASAVQATSASANANLQVRGKGTTSGVNAYNDSGKLGGFAPNGVTAPVNDLLIAPSATGGSPTIYAEGTDTDVSITVLPKGKGKFKAPTISMAQAVTLSGSSSNTNPTIFANTTSVGGTLTGNYFAYDFEVFNYNLAISLFASTMKVGASIGGPQMTGGYQNFYSLLQMDTASSKVGSHFYVGMLSEVEASVNDGGISGTASGHLFSANDTVTLNSGATFWRDCIGREIDIGLMAGSSVQFVAGVTVVSLGTSTVGGSQETVGFLVGKASGTTSVFDTAYGLGGGQGDDAISSTGWVMRYIPNIGGGEASPQIAGGVDFSGYTISVAAWKSPGCTIDGVGNGLFKSLQTPVLTVATLPAAAAGNKGMRLAVSDATAPTFLGTLTGGGAVVTPVFSNGTAWVAG